jgi:putative membrane protein
MAESTAAKAQTVEIAKETADLERKEIKKTAGAIKESAVELVDSADRTTQLAADRTVLAAERTYAAWVRTGLTALASGVGAKALLMDVIAQWMVIGAGTVLTLFSAFCFVAGVWRNLFSVRPPQPDIQRLPTWLLVIVNGSLALVALAALGSIWLPLF